MPAFSFFRYADVQARTRARLGDMPDAARWRYVADAGDLDNLIERMRASGLAHWVADLPRNPGTAAIEYRLRQHLLDLLNRAGQLLPAHWAGVGRRLALAGNLPWAATLLTEAEIEPPERIDAALRPIFSAPVGERRGRLELTPYHRYLSAASPVDRWLADLIRSLPRASGREAYVLARLKKNLFRYRERLLGLRRQAAEGGSSDHAAQWRLHATTADELRALIGGDPFHAGLVLIYCLLELLQYERCRALLTARARGWERPDILPGAA